MEVLQEGLMVRKMMYKWKVKNKSDRAYKKRMDVLLMSDCNQKIMVNSGMIGYHKYLYYIEFGNLKGFAK